MKANVALRASACVWNRQRARSSHSSVAKKLSHMALSYASPTEPIEGRTPASRQRWPNSIEVYWADSTDRRNTIFVGLSGDTETDPALPHCDTRRVHFDRRVSAEACDLASLCSTMLVAQLGQA